MILVDHHEFPVMFPLAAKQHSNREDLEVAYFQTTPIWLCFIARGYGLCVDHPHKPTIYGNIDG